MRKFQKSIEEVNIKEGMGTWRSQDLVSAMQLTEVGFGEGTETTAWKGQPQESW